MSTKITAENGVEFEVCSLGLAATDHEDEEAIWARLTPGQRKALAAALDPDRGTEVVIGGRLTAPESQFKRERDAAVARALADAGLLAPAPLREEWCAAYYGVYADGTRTLHTIGTEGSREHAEETRADCAQDDPDTRFFVARSYYTDWRPVDRAEGDGSTDQ